MEEVTIFITVLAVLLFISSMVELFFKLRPIKCNSLDHRKMFLKHFGMDIPGGKREITIFINKGRYTLMIQDLRNEGGFLSNHARKHDIPENLVKFIDELIVIQDKEYKKLDHEWSGKHDRI